MNRKYTEIEIISGSARETSDIARSIGEKLKGGEILALTGELGSGKTCFTGGIARGLGVDDKYRITSPTFTLINEYPARRTLYHFDVYRLKNYAEFEDLGYEEYLGGNGVVVIEWAEKIEEYLPEESLRIVFEYLDENRRKIVIKGPEESVKTFLKDIKTEVV